MLKAAACRLWRLRCSDAYQTYTAASGFKPGHGVNQRCESWTRSSAAAAAYEIPGRHGALAKPKPNAVAPGNEKNLPKDEVHLKSSILPYKRFLFQEGHAMVMLVSWILSSLNWLRLWRPNRKSTRFAAESSSSIAYGIRIPVAAYTTSTLIGNTGFSSHQ